MIHYKLVIYLLINPTAGIMQNIIECYALPSYVTIQFVTVILIQPTAFTVYTGGWLHGHRAPDAGIVLGMDGKLIFTCY